MDKTDLQPGSRHLCQESRETFEELASWPISVESRCDPLRLRDLVQVDPNLRARPRRDLSLGGPNRPVRRGYRPAVLAARETIEP